MLVHYWSRTPSLAAGRLWCGWSETVELMPVEQRRFVLRPVTRGERSEQLADCARRRAITPWRDLRVPFVLAPSSEVS